MPKVDLSKLTFDDEGNEVPEEEFADELSGGFHKKDKAKKRFDDGTPKKINQKKKDKPLHIVDDEEL